MAKKRIVVAFGQKAFGKNLPEQKASVKQAAKVVADLVMDGYQVAITHSNAHQVGMIHTAMNEFGKVHQDYTKAPMSVCSAMSQGFIGYDLQNAIREELLTRGIMKTVSTVLTQVIVDPYDDAFYKPIKVIGRYMTEQEAKEEEKNGNYVVEEPGKGWRRIVAAPKPLKIVELDAVKALLDADQIVIAAGGGGIPVMEQGCHLKGASAVIEKDLVSGLLASGVQADSLLILTKVENAALHYGTAEEKAVGEMTPEEARKYIAEGEFGENSMMPKIEASAEFVAGGEGRVAVITSLEKARDGVLGKAGTRIVAVR